MTHPADIGPTATRCLLAVMDGERTVRDVADRVGVFMSTAYAHLRTLRRHGLVDWEPGKASTLHATVAAVALTPCHGDPDAPDVEALPDRDPRPDSGG